jgi:putative ABC transport system permease protein
VVAGLTLALGIGPNTAIFSLLDAVLLRRLPYPRPHELVSVRADLRGVNLTNVGMSVLEMDDLRDHSCVFAGLSAAWPINAT